MYVEDLDLFVTVQLLEETPAGLSLGKLCSEHGCSYEWINGETPLLTKDGKTIACTMDNLVPPVVPGLSSSSSSSWASTSRPKDQSNSSGESETTSDPVTTRRAKRACGKPMQTNLDMQASGSRGLAHTEDETDKEDPTQGILDWLQPFTAKPESGTEKRQHSIYTHFSIDRNCDICLRTKITRVPCRRREKGSIPRAEKFCVLITADHKVLNERSESRNNHRHAVVVQDPSHSMDTILSVHKKIAGNGEESTNVSRAVTEAKSFSYVQFFRIWQIL